MLTSKGYIIQLEALMQQKQAMPGAKELIHAFQMENISYLILTERSSVTADEILNQLEHCGIHGVRKENIYTSTMAAVEYIVTHDKKAIDEAVKEAEKHKDADDKDELEAAVKALQDAIMPIGAKMYQQAAEDNKADESKDDKKSDKDEPVEGEVVDEK